jgi:hypothetical protein
MNSLDIGKLRSALPALGQWIEDILQQNKDQAVRVINLPFPRLKSFFRHDLLDKAKVVLVPREVPFFPLSSMGLLEFSQIAGEMSSSEAITYKDTFFLNDRHRTEEKVYFHELVHVVQWERLGVDNFLLAYTTGLIQSGYKNSPLENMAYSLQRGFEQGTLPPDIIEQIRQKTDTIWNGVASTIAIV